MPSHYVKRLWAEEDGVIFVFYASLRAEEHFLFERGERMNGAFCRRHTAVNFMFFAAVIVLAMFINHPVFMAVSFCASLAYAVRLKGKNTIKIFFCGLLPLLIFVTLLNALVSHYGVTVLYTFRSGNNLTLESVAYGAVTGALVVNMILWFMCYSEVVTEDKFMHLFGKRMPHVALLILMVLRFVPSYTKQIGEVIMARRSAGIEESGKFGKIRNAAAAVSGVITWALEHSIETADSMKSRGYGLKGRTSYSRFTFAPADFVLISLMFILTCFVVAGKVTGAADAIYNPLIQIVGISPMLVVSSVSYFMLCFLPLVYDWEEEIRWNRLYAKA